MAMLRYVFLIALYCCVLPCGALFAQEKPNIVLVMADDQGWGDMAYYDHPHLKTPHFDAAAATGIRFDRFYAAAPVCSPTRASVMTGRHPNRMGVFKWGYPIRPQELTLAEAVKTVGYATGHFGKWHLGSVRNNSPANPGRNGFDEWLSAPNFFDNNPILSRNGIAVQLHGESSMVTVDAALSWIEEQVAEDQPFLAVIWFGSPHSPHVAAEEDRRRYQTHPKNLQNFYGEITGMDTAFGKLRNALDRLRIRENTILWYCSDNGALPRVGSTGGHRGNKGMVYEGGLLVPSILEWPAKLSQPRVTDMRCNTCDIYPTILEITSAEHTASTELDGISLLPLIDKKMNQRSKGMGFWDYPAKGISTPSAKWMADLLQAQRAGGDLEPNESSINAGQLPDKRLPVGDYPGHAAWIEGDWKLHRIQGNGERVVWELYDLKRDPNETNDLSISERNQVDRMKPGFDKWLQSVVSSFNGDEYPSD
jgi:arylsulfatase A-like enzyme